MRDFRVAVSLQPDFFLPSEDRSREAATTSPGPCAGAGVQRPGGGTHSGQPGQSPASTDR